MTNYLAEAIKKLKPTAQFTFVDNDYSTIRWDLLEGDAPTQSEIDKAIKDIKAQEIKDEKAKVEAKAELLARLGITAEEAQLLLS
jgi:hypothetical protein